MSDRRASLELAGHGLEGVGRDLSLLYKFGPQGGRPLMARPLAGLLAAAARASGICRDIDLLAAVPSHGRRVRQRGFDAPHLLARGLARRLRLPGPARLLIRTDRQQPRSRSKQAFCPDGRFRLRRRAAQRIPGKTVLLLDDIFTTGTTLRECAQLLFHAGAGEVRGLVLARTPRRSMGSPQAVLFDRAGPIV
ncbi:MAG: ComF family protein [Acidobacteriota bacterium]